MRTLVFWGDAPLARARARAEQGDLILLWGRRDLGPGEPAFKTADWDPEKAARIEAAVAEWTRLLAEKPLLEGRPFRELFSWEGLPLWPLVERFFLGSTSAAAGCVRLVEAFGLVFETELPDEVEATGLGEDEVRLLERCCTAKGVLFQGAPRRGGHAARGTPSRRGPSLAGRLRAWGSALRSPRKLEPGTVVFVRPEAGPGDGGEALERLVLDARGAVPITVVGGEGGLAPETLEDGEARRAIRSAEEEFHKMFEVLKDAPATVAAFRHDDVGFADLAAAQDLDTLVLGRLAPAVRRAEGLCALLRRASPRALCACASDILSLHAGRLAGVPVHALAGAEDGARVRLALETAAREAGMVG